MARVLLGIGSNLGDREAALQSVVDAMAGRFVGVRSSHVYSTPAWGVTDQPPFLNAVIAAETELTPMQVLEFAHDCERHAQRVRDQHWGPRTLDVDVIAYDELRSDDPLLTLPHPHAHERAFVLLPLLELEPYFRFPGHGAAADLLPALDASGIMRHDTLRVAP